jgi:hypothetical protein
MATPAKGAGISQAALRIAPENQVWPAVVVMNFGFPSHRKSPLLRRHGQKIWLTVGKSTSLLSENLPLK